MTTRTEHRRGGRIAVGVDGSEGSKDALLWAARQAVATDASLQAVMTWDIPTAAYGFVMPVSADLYELGPQSEKALHQILEELRAEFPGIEVSGLVAQGRAGPTLLGAAEGADLLVVGSRGHGEVAGMLLGSVSEYCVTHATCPVVVVRYRPGASAG